jgi:hypothetical protein
VRGEAYPAGGLDLLAVLIISPGHDGLGAVFVGGGRVRGELIRGIIEIFVIGPVRATIGGLEEASRRTWWRDKALLC